MPPYREKYPIGARVRIADRALLEQFKAGWRLHNPLQANQLLLAGSFATVQEVSFYHGGEVLYALEGIEGIRHEECLMADIERDVDDVVDVLVRYHQRATYGAVGGLINRPPAFLMGGYDRNHRYSWVVNAETLLPTGYEADEMDPALLEREHVITSAAELEEWLENPA